MIKSMTGFSRCEAKEKSITATIELKTLNGKYLDVNCKIPRTLSHKELEIRDLIKEVIVRGNVYFTISLEYAGTVSPQSINEEVAGELYKSLQSLHKKLKVKEPLSLQHLLHFSNLFYTTEKNDNSEAEWRLVKNALKNALKQLDKMRLNEGQQIVKDINNRMKNISNTLNKVEELGLRKIPQERDRLRQRVAQLFESDEIDERRINLELVLLADKLDISEECVRLRSHIKFFFETMKSKEPVGRKINFLMQEMNREVNTIGSKANDTEIAHIVVTVKEELERIREQIQNIE